VCPQASIKMPENGDIRSRAIFEGTCVACGKCVAACPGLAITLLDRRGKSNGMARVTVPYELLEKPEMGAVLPVVDRTGEPLGRATVVQVVDKLARAPCSASCPAGVNAQGSIELIRKGRFREAVEMLRSDLPLPGVCGRVCYHPCEAQCPRAEIDAPISVNGLKRFVTDWAIRQNEPLRSLPVFHAQRVAVIGSGPSGLACANELLRSGYRVTVFEGAPLAGGMLRYGIPRYRLPDAVLDWDLARLRELGVEIRTATRVSSLAQLHEDGFAAVYLAVGAQRALRMEVPGESSARVVDALGLLRDARSGTAGRLRGTVAVVGGGNTALDAARTALRLGAREATVVYRRSEGEMPAHEQEVRDARAEGVGFEFLLAPIRVMETTSNRVRLQCAQMELGEADASGRRQPRPVPGCERALEADLVIVAIGQAVDPGEGMLDLGPSGTITVDPVTQATGLPGVFAGGDAATGPASVAEAFGAGKRAARSIHRFLSGMSLTDGRTSALPVAAATACGDVSREPRREAAVLLPYERRSSFEEILPALTEEDAMAEARRCLGCGVYSETLAEATSRTRQSRENTCLLTLEVEASIATRVAGVRAQDEAVTVPTAGVVAAGRDDDQVICRCERVTLGQIRRAIRHGVRDMNQLKAALNVGLGACGGKTCGSLLGSVFLREGISLSDVTPFTQRPLVAEVPLGVFAGAPDGGAEEIQT